MKPNLPDGDGRFEPRADVVEAAVRMLSLTFKNSIDSIINVKVAPRKNQNKKLHTHLNVISVRCRGLNSKNLSPSEIKNLEVVIKTALAGNISAPGYRKPMDFMVWTFLPDSISVECRTVRSALFDDGMYVPLNVLVHLKLLQGKDGYKAGTVGVVEVRKNFLYLNVGGAKNIVLGDVGQRIPTEIFAVVPDPASMLDDDFKRFDYEPDDWKKVISNLLVEGASELENACKRVERVITERERHAQRQLRMKLLVMCGDTPKCAVIGHTNAEALQCAHIKAWSACSETEGFDPENAVLLIACLHLLFDAYLISFDVDGKMLLADELVRNKFLPGLSLPLAPELLTQKRQAYMTEHRAEFMRRRRT